MKAKPQPGRSIQEEQIRTALAGTGTRRQSAMQTRNTRFTMTMPFVIIPVRRANPWEEQFAGLAESSSRQAVRLRRKADSRKRDLWITEYTITYQGRLAYTVSIMEFRDGKVVHETQYFGDPFEAPAWRREWFSRSRDAAPSSGYTICYDAKSGQGQEYGNAKAKTRTLEIHRPVLSVISAAKLRVRPDGGEFRVGYDSRRPGYPCPSRATTTNWVCLHTGN